MKMEDLEKCAAIKYFYAKDLMPEKGVKQHAKRLFSSINNDEIMDY